MTESPTALVISGSTRDDSTVAHLRRFVVECADLRELERSLGRLA